MFTIENFIEISMQFLATHIFSLFPLLFLKLTLLVEGIERQYVEDALYCFNGRRPQAYHWTWQRSKENYINCLHSGADATAADTCRSTELAGSSSPADCSASCTKMLEQSLTCMIPERGPTARGLKIEMTFTRGVRGGLFERSRSFRSC